MEHGSKDIAFYVQKHIAPCTVAITFLLVRHQPLGAPVSVKRVIQFYGTSIGLAMKASRPWTEPQCFLVVFLPFSLLFFQCPNNNYQRYVIMKFAHCLPELKTKQNRKTLQIVTNNIFRNKALFLLIHFEYYFCDFVLWDHKTLGQH